MSDTPLTHSDNQEPTAFTQAQLEWLPWLPPLPEDELTDRHCAGLVDAARRARAVGHGHVAFQWLHLLRVGARPVCVALFAPGGRCAAPAR